MQERLSLPSSPLPSSELREPLSTLCPIHRFSLSISHQSKPEEWPATEIRPGKSQSREQPGSEGAGWSGELPLATLIIIDPLSFR